MLDRCCSPNHLNFLLECIRSSDIKRQQDGIIALYTVLPNVTDRIINNLKVLKQTVRLLFRAKDENVATYALMTIHQLVKDNERRSIKCVGYKVIPHLIRITCMDPQNCRSKIYWIIMVLYQFSMSEVVTTSMVREKVHLLLLELATRKYGAVSALKYCIHTLVRIISTVPDNDATIILNELYELHCLDILSAALRNS